MIWLILTHFLVLTFLSFHQDRLKSTDSLRPAWKSFLCVFFVNALFTLFRAVNFDSQGLLFVEIWANGFIWLFLGLSLYKATGLFFGEEKSGDEAEESD